LEGVSMLALLSGYNFFLEKESYKINVG
jgi:hypothetical protein